MDVPAVVDAPRLLLAQASGGVLRIWLWGAVLIALAVGALFVMLAIKRRFIGGGENKSSTWTLQDLRELHAAGQLSDEEYRTLRDQVVGSVGARPNGDKGKL
jgi:uncharacterized membrane protein